MITHGDFQTWITEGLHKSLTKVINAKSDMKTPYYILVVFKKGYHGPPSRVDNHLLNDSSHADTLNLEGKNVLSTRLILTNSPPKIKLVGTALLRVNNKIGEVKWIYCLPPDKPVQGTSFEDEKAKDAEFVAKSMQGMSLVYND